MLHCALLYYIASALDTHVRQGDGMFTVGSSPSAHLGPSDNRPPCRGPAISAPKADADANADHDRDQSPLLANPWSLPELGTGTGMCPQQAWRSSSMHTHTTEDSLAAYRAGTVNETDHTESAGRVMPD